MRHFVDDGGTLDVLPVRSVSHRSRMPGQVGDVLLIYRRAICRRRSTEPHAAIGDRIRNPSIRVSSEFPWKDGLYVAHPKVIRSRYVLAGSDLPWRLGIQGVYVERDVVLVVGSVTSATEDRTHAGRCEQVVDWAVTVLHPARIGHTG